MNSTVGFSQSVLLGTRVMVVLNFLVILKTCGCPGGAHRMDSTAFVVGRLVDRKFGPGPSIAVNPFVPQGLASVVLPLARFSGFPAAPRDSVLFRSFTTLPMGAIASKPPLPYTIALIHPRAVSLCPAFVCQLAEVPTSHMVD